GRHVCAVPVLVAITTRYRPLTNDVSEVEPQFYSALAAIARLPAEDDEGHFRPLEVWLSKAGIERFEEFRKFIEETKRELDGREREWWVKVKHRSFVLLVRCRTWRGPSHWEIR